MIRKGKPALIARVSETYVLGTESREKWAEGHDERRKVCVSPDATFYVHQREVFWLHGVWRGTGIGRGGIEMRLHSDLVRLGVLVKKRDEVV